MEWPETDIQKAIEYMKNYLDQYHEGNFPLSTETWIDDMIYGIGVSINEKEHLFATGFELFKSKLIRHINEN